MRAPSWVVLTAAAASIAFAPTTVRVPLCAGLTIVTAINQPEGDYESIKQIVATDADSVRLKYSVERVERSMPGRPIQKFIVNRSVRIADLRNATQYLQEFGPASPVEVPGTTAIGTSAAVLAALKATGQAKLTLFDLPNTLPSQASYSASRTQHPSVFDYQVPFTLKRADPASVTVALTVNGERTELPAIHATGSGEWGEKGEFFFLDDETNPLTLRSRYRTSSVSATDHTQLQVVRMTYRCNIPVSLESRLERALAAGQSVDVYDIFFSFNSDDIRDESEPTLVEIGDVLRRHPDWKLTIAGHTDGIAGDAFNLDLSKRRAAAVKNALVTRFSVDPRRLATAGYGKSRPRDTNETPEGRARNRRVELARQP